MIFRFKIEEPDQPPKIVHVGPHETAYGAHRAIRHVYAEGTKFTLLAEGESLPEPTPSATPTPITITPSHESANS